MTKRTAPIADAPIAAETWFVDLITTAHVAARARMHQGASADVAIDIERSAWLNLARSCAAAPWEG